MNKCRETLSGAVTILIGSAIFAFGFNWCFLPNHLSMGGVTGIGQIIHAFLPGLPLGLTVIILNLPLFILSWRRLGGRFLVGSLTAMAVGNVMIDALNAVYTFPPMEPLLAALYGGLMIGLAMGLMLRRDITTGGTDLAARLLKLRWAHLPIGQLCLVLDVAVVVSYSLVFKDLDRALYSLVAIYVVSLVIDHVVYGGDSAKMAFIISNSPDRIAKALLTLDRGVTVLHGAGAYSGKDKEVLFCVCKRNQIAHLKQLVKGIDPDAFLVVSEAREVLGEGFNLYKENSI